jgi:putative Holliday junction resolvase
MKLIGIDYGMRRIGLAATDESGEFIRSLPTIDRKKSHQFLEDLCGIIASENASQIVIGLPLNDDGGDTSMSLEIRAFAARLSQKITVPIKFVDESLTSVRANDIIRYRKKKQRREKGNVDKIAACLILEEFKREQA